MVSMRFTRLATILITASGLSACSREPEPTPSPIDAPAPVVEAAEPMGIPLEVKVGVQVCDEFLDKYRACVKRVGPSMATSLKEGLQKSALNWADQAKDPERHSALASACMTLDSTVADSMRAQGCVWNVLQQQDSAVEASEAGNERR